MRVQLVLTYDRDDHGAPAEVALKRLLKAAKRAYGWRCLDCRELPAAPAAETFGCPLGGDSRACGGPRAPLAAGGAG